MKKSFGKTLGLLLLGSFAFVLLGYAEEDRTDRYAPVYNQPLAPEPLKGTLSRILEAPFQLIKWPVDKSILFTEKHRLDKKTLWLYKKSLEQGVKPLFGTVDVSAIPYYGAEFNLLTIARQQERFPDFFARAKILHGPSIFFQTGIELGAQRIAGTGFHLKGSFNYDQREKEPFYGIGPDTSMGDGTSFKIETTQVGAAAGYEFSPSLDLVAGFDYKHSTIRNRAHDGKGNILTIFANQNIPGVHGDDLLEYTLALNRDTRDSKDEASKGSYQKLLFQFSDGVNGSAARYFTYRLDMAKYFQLASPRRILAARLFAEHNDEVGHGYVPFYNMAKLGGAGFGPRYSETERGYVYNRFFGESALLLNLEYRYTVMEYNDFKMRTAFFVDEGQVFGEIHEFQFKDFRTSYGVGFYLTYSKNTILNFSVAHSNEGTRFYLKNKFAF